MRILCVLFWPLKNMVLVIRLFKMLLVILVEQNIDLNMLVILMVEMFIMILKVLIQNLQLLHLILLIDLLYLLWEDLIGDILLMLLLNLCVILNQWWLMVKLKIELKNFVIVLIFLVRYVMIWLVLLILLIIILQKGMLFFLALLVLVGINFLILKLGVDCLRILQLNIRIKMILSCFQKKVNIFI